MRWPNIPRGLDTELYQFCRDLLQGLDNEFKARVPNTQGTADLLLVSPAGKVYSVRVDDAGALSTTLINE